MSLITPQSFQMPLPPVSTPGASVAAAPVSTTPSADTVKFQGSMAGAPTPVTVKLPKRTAEQLAYLSKTLNLPIDEIASKASSLYTQANEGSSLLDRPFVGLVDREALNARFSNPNTLGNHDQLFSTLDLTDKEFSSWKKQNVSKLSLSRGAAKKVADRFKSSEPFTYKYQATEGEGAAAIGTFFGLVIPGLQVILPFTVPAMLIAKGNKKRSLYNGVNLLHEAVQAKVKNPALRLVSVQVNRTDKEGGNPYISVTNHDSLFRNLTPQA